MITELTGLKDFISQRFDALDGRIDQLADKVEATNGRVRAQEILAAVQTDRIETLRRDVGTIQAAATPRRSSEGEGEAVFRQRLQWVCWAAGSGAGAVLALLKLLGKV